MRSYKVEDGNRNYSYTGFDKNIDTKCDIVITSVDNELEVWAIDNSTGFDNLIAFLANPLNRAGNVSIIGRYSPMNFHGVVCPAFLVHQMYD